MPHHESPVPKARSLVQYLEEIPDPRVKRRREHKLVDILAIGLCSITTGGEGFNDMALFGKIKRDWLKTFLELPHGIPSHDTFNRVFSAVDPHCFLDCFVRWVQGICPALAGDVVAIDGKALRRALNQGDSIPYIVSAWASENGLALGQVKVNDKSNEITVIPELLQVLALQGCTVTIDAMGCQKDIAAQIVDKKADYVLALKGNHATMHEEIREFFADAVPPCADQAAKTVTPQTMASSKTLEKDHGRIETRRYWQSTDVDWMQDKKLWKNLRSMAWSNPSAASRARTPSSAATIFRVSPWASQPSPRPCGAIGASKTHCTGHSMSRFAKIRVAPGQKTPRKTSPPCVASRSTSSKRIRSKKSPSDKNEYSPPSTQPFWRNYWGFKCVCPAL